MDAISDVMTNIITASRTANAENSGDYIGDDGLLHCIVCDEPKQAKITLFGDEITVGVACKCRIEAEKQKEAERKERERAEYISRLRLECFPKYSKYTEMTFKDSGTTPELLKAKAYCDKFTEFKDKGKGLLLYGECGTGKTHIAACIANDLINRGYPVKFTTMAKIVNRLQASFDGREQFFDELRQVPMLIIDDFRAERSTEFMHETTYEVINGRTEAGLPLIVTTNLTNADFKDKHDVQTERIISRLLGMTIPIEVKGTDRRRERVRNDYAADKTLLEPSYDIEEVEAKALDKYRGL